MLQVTATDSQRPEGHEDGPARPADGEPDVQLGSRRPERHGRREDRGRPARARGDRGGDHDDLRGVSADGRRHVLRVRLVVGRQGTEPRGHGAGHRHDVHGELRPADEADVRRRSRTPASRRRTPNTTYGTQNKLRVDGGADPDIQSYLRFNVTGVADGTVVSAKLRLSSTTGLDRRADAALGGQHLDRVDGQLVEPADRRRDRDRRPRRRSPRTRRRVQREAARGRQRDGHASRCCPTSSDGLDFASREYADATRRPVLELLVSDADHTAPTAPTGLDARGDRRTARGPLMDARDRQPRASPTTRSTVTARCSRRRAT